MSSFSYRARDMNGVLVTGQVDGLNIHGVREVLSDQGLIPISIVQNKGIGGINLSKEGIKQAFKNMFNRVKPDELMLFTLQFFTLFKAGMNIESILHTLAAQTENEYFGEIIMRIKTDVSSGSSLAKAFAKHPQIFSDLYVNMLETGEEAGILDGVLSKLAELLEKDLHLQQSINSAMTYPKIVVGALFIASFVMMKWVIPKFKDLFDSFGAELPLPTRIMITSSNIFQKWWLVMLVSAVVAKKLFSRWKATPQGRLKWDQLMLKTPVFGILNIKVANARFAHILGALYKAGVPVIKGLQISAKTIGNEAFTKEIMSIQNSVEKGKGIADSMRGLKYFSSLLVEATAIGEKTGALDDMYRAIGEHYDMEVDQMVDKLATYLEPILLVIIMGGVTIFALAVLLPMWSLSQAVHA